MYYRYSGDQLASDSFRTDYINGISASPPSYYAYHLTYNSSDNVTSVELFMKNPQDELEKYRQEFTQFDDKVNFLRTINGLPSLFWNSFGSGVYVNSFTAHNNALAERDYYTVNATNPYQGYRDIAYTYEYNDAGLPTKISGPYGYLSMQYERYK